MRFITRIVVSAALIAYSSNAYSDLTAKPSDTASAPPLYVFETPRTESPTEVTGNRHFWIEIMSQFRVVQPAPNGFGLRVGYQFGIFGLDLKYLYSNTRYGDIGVMPDPAIQSTINAANQPVYDPTTGTYVTPTSDKEIDRARQSGDPWTQRLYEPGLNITGHLIPQFPNLLQKGRMGVSLGKMIDHANGLSFSSALISMEGALQYQLPGKSRFAIEVSMNYRYGIAYLDGVTGDKGNLPLSYVTAATSLLCWF